MSLEYFNRFYYYCFIRVIWDLDFGSNIKFYGRTIFYNSSNSRIKIGDDCVFVSSVDSINLIGINRPCILSTQQFNAQIIIGNNSGFSGTVISAFNSIIIGDNVKCGANTLISDSDWHLEDCRSGPVKSIKIDNNVWLGEGVKVLKGVHIGENTVIGAGSIVTKSIPSNVIAVGNPCQVIREL